MKYIYEAVEKSVVSRTVNNHATPFASFRSPFRFGYFPTYPRVPSRGYPHPYFDSIIVPCVCVPLRPRPRSSSLSRLECSSSYLSPFFLSFFVLLPAERLFISPLDRTRSFTFTYFSALPGFIFIPPLPNFVSAEERRIYVARANTELSSWASSTILEPELLTKRSTPGIGDVVWAPVLLNIEPHRHPRRPLRCASVTLPRGCGRGHGMLSNCHPHPHARCTSEACRVKLYPAMTILRPARTVCVVLAYRPTCLVQNLGRRINAPRQVTTYTYIFRPFYVSAFAVVMMQCRYYVRMHVTAQALCVQVMPRLASPRVAPCPALDQRTNSTVNINKQSEARD
ncbi:hypothetical protein EDB92DRAFT_910957 [Lactarius akahatsu]|uniref:Uncharacterized protein n=1 Tax=Lactarius akahatsu TaxID=416441 RepID=A0AAD4LH40_9AGAM|nr:hypothetical protein EDB92DRAFT_910957 [Lactarius akahatsu]